MDNTEVNLNLNLVKHGSLFRDIHFVRPETLVKQ